MLLYYGGSHIFRAVPDDSSVVHSWGSDRGEESSQISERCTPGYPCDACNCQPELSAFLDCMVHVRAEFQFLVEDDSEVFRFFGGRDYRPFNSDSSFCVDLPVPCEGY